PPLSGRIGAADRRRNFHFARPQAAGERRSRNRVARGDPMSRQMRNQRGFTLLEALVATMIMGVAVAGIMNALAASSRNVVRLTQADRAVLLARTKMDALLLDDGLPRKTDLAGSFSTSESGAMTAGWRARVTP